MRTRLQLFTNGLLASFGILKQFPVLIPLGIITLLDQLMYSGVNNVTLSKYIPYLGVPKEWEGRAITAIVCTFLVSEAILRVPFGWLSDRYGRARMIIAAELLTVPTILLSGFIPVGRWEWLFPLRWWDGMMAAALWPSVFALIGDTVPDRYRANAMGVINMMYMLALFAGFGLAGGVLSATGNPRTFFFIGAGILAFAGVATWLFFRARPDLHAPHPEVHLEDAERAVVSVSRHTVLLIITFVQNFAITVLAPLMYRYATDKAPGGLGFSLPELALLAGVPVVGVALFAIPLSRAADQVGKVAVVRVAFTVVAVCLWLFSVNHSLPVLAIIATLMAVAFSMGIPAWMAILSSLSGTKTRGVTLAGYGTVQGLAAVSGVLVSGVIWDLIGHAQIFMASAAAVSIAALLTWLALPEHAPRSTNVEQTV